ncbi:MAG TPA: TerC family protein [Verrucomicrobiae bacterium]
MTEITPWHWIGFVVFVVVCVTIDMGAFSRRARIISFREALVWSSIWCALAMLFAALVNYWRGAEEATEFVTGYLIELSLSLDNILVIALIFTAFKVPLEYQRRVLVFGILGALVMRGVMIGVGAELVQHFKWVLYIFGVFLLFTGVKMFFSKQEAIEPEKNPVIRLARKVFPISSTLEGQKFTTRLNGRKALTPLALVLLLVETTDLIFAVDSVPAVFAVTQKAFIVFTSNVFAILGLRSLYFLLAGAIAMFKYLKAGLSVVLIFVGAKMLLDPHDHPAQWFQAKIPTGVSLLVVAMILTVAIGLSMISARGRISTTDEHR